jgi:hypothetical protein
MGRFFQQSLRNMSNPHPSRKSGVGQTPADSVWGRTKKWVGRIRVSPQVTTHPQPINLGPGVRRCRATGPDKIISGNDAMHWQRRTSFDHERSEEGMFVSIVATKVQVSLRNRKVTVYEQKTVVRGGARGEEKNARSQTMAKRKGVNDSPDHRSTPCRTPQHTAACIVVWCMGANAESRGRNEKVETHKFHTTPHNLGSRQAAHWAGTSLSSNGGASGRVY